MTVRKSVWTGLSALTAGATLLCGLTLWTSSHSQSIDKPDTPLKVALVLDCITQPRFQDDMKNFGLSRMLPTAGGHLVAGKILLPSQKDRDLFKSAENAHRDFEIAFVHCAHVPGSVVKVLASDAPGERSPSLPATSKRGGGFGAPLATPREAETTCRLSEVCNRMRHLYAARPKTADEETATLFQEMTTTAQKALPKLKQGQGVEQSVGDWLVVIRPVRAMKTSCLKCHEGAKLGDTLGALAYAVSKQTFAAVLPTAATHASVEKGGGF